MKTFCGALVYCVAQQMLEFMQEPSLTKIEWPDGVKQSIPVLPETHVYLVQ